MSQSQGTRISELLHAETFHLRCISEPFVILSKEVKEVKGLAEILFLKGVSCQVAVAWG